MTRLHQFILSILMLVTALPVYSQITVQTENNALVLAQRIVGTGVTITNAKFTGSNIASGIFDAVPSSFPLTSGIVLTSGRARTIGTGMGQRGVNGAANYDLTDDAFHASSSNGEPGDADLNTYSGKNTLDACVLEFDFIPQGDSINVRYIFGSEEYPRYNCSNYNDVFAFLITGPGFSTATNIALVPNTNIPVAINSINDGIVGSSGGGNIGFCTGMGGGSPFTQYYVSNQGGTILAYNGRTVVLTAKAKVQPCNVYHIKLAIADAEDRVLDSGVFIEAESFSSNPEFKPSITGPLVDANNNVVLVEACKSAELRIKRSQGAVGPFTVNVTYGGTATPAVDFTALPAQINFAAGENEKVYTIDAFADALNEGTEKAVFYFSKFLTCTQQLADSIVITIQDSLITKAKKDTFLCSNSSIIIKSTDPVANTTNTYAWNTGSATQSILVSQPGTYYVAHTYSQRCVNIDTFNVQNADPTFSITNPIPAICDDGTTDITVTTNADTVRWSTGATTKTVTITSPGEYWVLVKNKYSCAFADTFDVVAKPSPTLNLGPDVSICPGETVLLDASFPGASYAWSTGSAAASIVANATGTYTVTSTGTNGCASKDTININSKVLAIANAGPDLIVVQNQSIQLNAVTSADNKSYLWSPAASLNNPAAPNPLASPSATTEYTLLVTSVDGCTAQDKVWVTIQYPLLIPNAFSPNGDGINEKWNIGNIQFYPQSKVYIFNRYGQQMFFSTGYREPWDGTYKGKKLEPATYYYVVEPGDGRRFGGWVVLLL